MNNQINFSTNVLDICNTNISKYSFQIQLQEDQIQFQIHSENLSSNTIPNTFYTKITKTN